MKTTNILFIDTDPGVDDALAITMINNLSNETKKYDKIIYSSIGGNTSLKNTHQNMMNILKTLQSSYSEISKGSERTLLGQKFVDAEHYHGKNGLTTKLNNSELNHTTIESYELLQNLYLEDKGTKITFLMLGPLTNLAKALITIPSISNIIKEVIIMGGAFYVEGNATQYSEFNIYADPEAANIVFKSDIPIKAIGLDVCDEVIINRDRFYESKYLFTESKTKNSKFSNLVIDSFFDFHSNKSKMSLCDPIAVVCLFYENLFEYKLKNVTVNLDKLTKGQTIPSKQKGNVSIAVNLNFNDVMQIIDKSLS
jgi:inosine-uridine nucleoside N-ribohydrolase